MMFNDHIEANSVAITNFESVYIAARDKENRLYTDEQVAHLPLIELNHPHKDEWQVRKRSSQKLYKRLQKKKTAFSILEVGCGNGWLSALLSGIEGAGVTGMDINESELAQARKVFSKKQNLSFMYGDIRAIDLQDKKFDVILFAASVQYFHSLENVVTAALSLLNKNGEIHIIDSKFYPRGEVMAASKRSYDYYQSLGCAAMSNFYFHHSIESVKQFNYKLLFNPASLGNRFFRKDPFPWIMITA